MQHTLCLSTHTNEQTLRRDNCDINPLTAGWLNLHVSSAADMAPVQTRSCRFVAVLSLT
jgi:hypothetical protein